MLRRNLRKYSRHALSVRLALKVVSLGLIIVVVVITEILDYIKTRLFKINNFAAIDREAEYISFIIPLPDD